MLKQLSAITLCIALIAPFSAEAAMRRTNTDTNRVSRILNRPCDNTPIEEKARCLSRQARRQSIGSTTSAAANSSYERLNAFKKRAAERLNLARSDSQENDVPSVRRSLRSTRAVTSQGVHQQGARTIVKNDNAKVNQIRNTRAACMGIVSRRERANCLDGIANGSRKSQRVIRVKKIDDASKNLQMPAIEGTVETQVEE